MRSIFTGGCLVGVVSGEEHTRPEYWVQNHIYFNASFDEGGSKEGHIGLRPRKKQQFIVFEGKWSVPGLALF